MLKAAIPEIKNEDFLASNIFTCLMPWCLVEWIF